jgi:hypothetical protein
MRGAGILVAILAFVLPGLLLAPVWRLAALGAGEDDLLYYYPARVWLHELAHDRLLPLLNPYNGLDRPMLADPQHAVFYPSTWMFLALPPAMAYPASLWLHFSLALAGMYRLLRAQKLDRRASGFGAIAFAFCGFMLAQERTHFTILHSAAWTPWVFWRLGRFALRGGARRLVWAAALCGLQCLSGHIQIAALTALGSLIWLIGHMNAAWFAVVRRWLTAWTLAGLLAAVQLAPTLLYLLECTRTERTFLDFVENSWYPQSVLTWTLPMLLGQRTPNFFEQPYWGPSHQVEQFAYCGVLVLLGTALALRSGWRADAGRRPWAILLIASLLIALGLFGPVAPILYLIPGASVFRVPARAMLLVELAAAALAAGVVHDLGAKLNPQRARLRANLRSWCSRPLVLIAILAGVPLVGVVVTTPFLPEATRAAAWKALLPWNSAVWVPLLVITVSIFVLRSCGEKWRETRRLSLLPVILAIDLGIIGWTIDVPHDAGPGGLPPPSESRAALLERLRGTRSRLWVVTARTASGTPGEYIDPWGKLVANTNLLDHVPSLTDYGPLTPKRYDRAFHFKPWGEAENAAEMMADDEWMQWYDIGWLLLCEPKSIPPDGCTLETTTRAGYRLYQYPFSRGRAYFENATQPGAVRYVEKTPYSFETHVDTWAGDVGGGEANPRIVIARLALPGWSARWRGGELSIEPAGGTLLSVRLPRDRPIVIQWTYWPPGLALGATITAFAVVVSGLLWMTGNGAAQQPAKSRRRRPAQQE